MQHSRCKTCPLIYHLEKWRQCNFSEAQEVSVRFTVYVNILE